MCFFFPPPVLKEFMAAVRASGEEARARITRVRYGPVEGKHESILFDFDGKPYSGYLRGRTKDLVLGVSETCDREIARRVLLDGHAKPVRGPR